MNIIRIIEHKRDKQILSESEISYFIDAYCHNQIKDYQASSLLMAMYINGLNKAETFALTKAMIHSGVSIDLSHIEGIKVDKHSSGGVGDKTTLALAPMLAACGLIVAKMSGRGLGHTGGTLDKLEAISGLQIDLSETQFMQQLQDVGVAIISQNEEMVLADKKLYALRDVCGCISSIPLIASSIMSKKIASGADYILLDVKYGDGAFMETKEKAASLAALMIEIGEHFNRHVKVEITSMEEPLGFAIGNSLEVQEAIDTLLGKGPDDFSELCIHSGGVLLHMCGKCDTIDEGKKMMLSVIQNGSAYQKLIEMVKAQGGRLTNDTFTFPKALYQHPVVAKESGYITKIHTQKLGMIACELGAGRKTKEDAIEASAGIVLSHKVNAMVNEGDLLATLYTNKTLDNDVLKHVQSCFEIGEIKGKKEPLIYKIL